MFFAVKFEFAEKMAEIQQWGGGGDGCVSPNKVDYCTCSTRNI